MDMTLLDTRSKGKDLTGTFIADLVLQIHSYVAQTERENIKRCQKEGIIAAQKRGVKFSRPRLEIPHHFTEIKTQWDRKELSSRQAASLLGVSQYPFLQWTHLYSEAANVEN